MFRGSKPPGLKAKALQWLAQRDQSRQELREKLLRWQSRVLRSQAAGAAAAAAGGDDDADEDQIRERIDTLLDELVSSGLLSDARFAESRVQARQARFGNRRIQGELRQHGVAPPPELLEQLKVNEVDRARRVLLARFDGARPAPSSERAELARRQRFLAARGFSAEAIRAALRHPATED